MTPQTLLNNLFSIPSTLTFPLRTIDSDSSILHGSLTLDDVLDRIETEYGLLRSDVSISWADPEIPDRMKELGVRSAVIGIRGMGGERNFVYVEATRLEQDENA